MPEKKKNGDDTVIVLHNIRSVYNVGSIFRTADAAGVSKIFLTGYTPIPVDRFGRVRKDLSKVALGAEKTVPWEFCRDIGICLRVLQKKDVRVVAVEQDARAVDFRKLSRGGRNAFVFGNEVRGLSPAVLSKTDSIVEIPMHGTKESLNVSVAVGIILFC